ncbi:plasmid replication protein RepC [Tianweitania populi]|uniref:Replication initiation protein n=1 Tax=Tianweitania populi TaxID=1607949 RepID=A0A8J3DYX7_9HYPH|nr:plasmid replication protein RepC [Tianweitania populi]GHD21015.1 replication initiation protein [Tianweitania populi]
MTERLATTPFGGGRMTAAKFQRRQAIDRQREGLAKGGNDTGRAEKYALLKALTEARGLYKLSDRTIAVLEALLSFHPDRELDGTAPIIVFPSNAELSLRTRGMADATLRRHLAALVEAGLVLRRDSPNGKRYCQRNERGVVENAFGFDLSPLALAAAGIHAAAEDMRDESRLCHRLRGEITIHLRDVGKIIEAGLAETRAGDWQGFALSLMPLGRRLARNAERPLLEARRDALLRLRAEVETSYLNSMSEQEMSGNDADFERHYQNSKTDHHYEKGSANELKEAPSDNLDALSQPNGTGRPDTKEGRAPETKSTTVPLSYLLAVCPALATYARDGIADWRSVLTTAELVRSMLGISADAWTRAREAMGDLGAAMTIAAILERAEHIRSPGGYLRALTERAEAGKFSVIPMLAALENGQPR